MKSKFYGKSFDINPLGTWFLRLRPAIGGEELYTWKKVTSSVIGIITSAYQVAGKVCDKSGRTRWSIGGKWNDKIYARLTPGYEDAALGSGKHDNMSADQAFLVWEAHARPGGVPFNLTPFVLTLNALPERLRPWLAPTDTRLRPDQRAMEDGEYDFAATEKSRLEDGQRARRKEREQNGEEFVPRWFKKAVCTTTGEAYWHFNGDYWPTRTKVGEGSQQWEGLEPIYQWDEDE